MSAQENIQKVQQIYAAFGKGDLPGLLDGLADNVDWQVLGPSIIPQSGPHRGRKEVEKFFAKVAESYDIQKFELREFIAQDDKVVVLGYYAGVVKKTGKNYEAEWAMAFTLREGKVVKFREYANTAALVAALTP
ncbi:MAG: nuclear transport factor 2 family protein [bacterium]